MLIEHSLQVHRERSESLRTSLRHGAENPGPSVQQSPYARLGTVIVARLPPFLNDGRQRAIRHEAALERTQDEAFRSFVGQRQGLEAADTVAFHLLELAGRSNRMGDGFADAVLSEARVLSGNEQVGGEREIVTDKTSRPGAKAQRERAIPGITQTDSEGDAGKEGSREIESAKHPRALSGHCVSRLLNLESARAKQVAHRLDNRRVPDRIPGLRRRRRLDLVEFFAAHLARTAVRDQRGRTHWMLL